MPPPRPMPEVIAALGPTNTGKTHRAVERMLEHATGMIGLPLRLLAREVYDRVSARVGEQQVALVTGEEKRVPDRPSYWVCTTEAMPLERRTDFAAVDEIQLAADRERGHVFTDRLLHLRGLHETWFLGSDTMRGLVERLVPGVRHQRLHRLSKLSYVAPRSLKATPARAAVVAFSTEQVYELAERLRRHRGGVAVVHGALSPATRNAQVAMYQAGEVQHLVATDAIGMGLNLDIDHVAFASLRKFDGRQYRKLRSHELAQIAGRAGRHLNDGTFSVVRPEPELDVDVVQAIESHRFRPVERLVWRNSDLDFSSVASLLRSLSVPTPSAVFQRVERADDFEALRALADDPHVTRLTTDEDAVRLLWEVCGIPDFRKLLLHRHLAILRSIFGQLRTAGALDEDWLDRQLRSIERVDGGLDQLTARLSAVRTWTYVTHRRHWLADAPRWQARSRAAEDALSEALHERLVDRFIERRPSSPRRKPARKPGGGSDGPFAKLAELLEADADPAVGAEATVQRVVEAEHAQIEADRRGHLRFDGQVLGRLVRGKEVHRPGIALAVPDDWPAGARRRLERRLLAWSRDLLEELGASLAVPADASPSLRGLAYRFQESLGLLRLGDARAMWEALERAERKRLLADGVQLGRRYLFSDRALTPLAFERRRLLVALHDEARPPKAVPQEPVLRATAFAGAQPWAFGYEQLGTHAVRADVVERLLEALSDGDEAFVQSLDLPDAAFGPLGYRRGADGKLRRSRRRRRRRRP